MIRLTKELHEKMGIAKIADKTNPNMYHIEGIGDVELTKPFNMKHIFSKIYELGHQSGRISGVKEGEMKKVNQFKELLNIE